MYSALCLDIPGFNKTQGTKLQQWSCNGGDNQKWRVIPSGGGYAIVSVNSNMCLDVPGYSNAAGAIIQQWPCNGGTNQQWNFVPLGGLPGWYKIVSRSSGQCLDLPASSMAQGTLLQQWPCHTEFEANQVWSLQCGGLGASTLQNCCPTPNGGGMTCGDPSMVCVDMSLDNGTNTGPDYRCSTCGGNGQPCCTGGQWACQSGLNCVTGGKYGVCNPPSPPPPPPPPVQKTCSGQTATSSAKNFNVGLRNRTTGCGGSAPFFANSLSEASTCASRVYGNADDIITNLTLRNVYGSYTRTLIDGTSTCADVVVSVFYDGDIASCEQASCESVFGTQDGCQGYTGHCQP
jgi:hypothetical protein